MIFCDRPQIFGRAAVTLRAWGPELSQSAHTIDFFGTDLASRLVFGDSGTTIEIRRLFD